MAGTQRTRGSRSKDEGARAIVASLDEVLRETGSPIEQRYPRIASLAKQGVRWAPHGVSNKYDWLCGQFPEPWQAEAIRGSLYWAATGQLPSSAEPTVPAAIPQPVAETGRGRRGPRRSRR